MAKKQNFDKDIHLSSFDDLFQTDESREDMKREKLMDIPISKIQDFPEHPYKVKDDENMVELVESVKTRGLIQPVLVRPLDNGMYEMVSGHRRKRAFEIAGIEKIPARVQNLTKDEAILSMVDSNLQRDEILPSEKAFAFKMRLEAMKRIGGRPSKENGAPVEHPYLGQKSRDVLAEEVGESREQIRRFIRLTNLIPEMLDLVDDKKIAMRPAVEISYTNRVWPNKLYTPDGQGLWTAASAIGSSSKETFDNILTKGYGAGIAYNETSNKTYTIKFNGNGSTSGSTASMTMTYGVAKNLTANGFKKTGNSFVKWNTKANGSGTSYTNKQSVKNLTSTQGATVNLYAQWDPYDLKVYYNANGGSIDSTKYYLSSKNVYKESDSSRYYQTWTYNSTKADGLVNASTFGLYRTGYRFTKWGTSTTGGTLFDQNDATVKPTDLNSNIKTGDCTRTLYAQWTPNTYTIKFDGNGSTSGSTASMSMTYDVAKNLTANGFTKSGYHFSGWNTKALF